MNRIKTALLAGVLGFSGVVSLIPPAATADARPVPTPARVPATHTMAYAPRPSTFYAQAARAATAPAHSAARPVRDWTTGRDLTLAKPWLTPSR